MKAITATLFFSFLYLISFGQQGTYRLMLKGGASCTISIRTSQAKVTSEIFAWWNNASDATGSFMGTGSITNQNCTLASLDDSDCLVKLKFSSQSLNATFEDCMSSNLPEDFSGNYRKLTDRTPGIYHVRTPKAYLYKTAGSQHRLNAYLIKGNRVKVEIENIEDAKWVFVNYTNSKGKTSSGYLLWEVLK